MNVVGPHGAKEQTGAVIKEDDFEFVQTLLCGKAEHFSRAVAVSTGAVILLSTTAITIKACEADCKHRGVTFDDKIGGAIDPERRRT